MINPNVLNSDNEKKENENVVNESPSEITDKIAGDESPNLRKSEQLRQDAENFYLELYRQYDGKIPDNLRRYFNEMTYQINQVIKKAQVEETLEIIPESQREAFKEYAEDFMNNWADFDIVTNGIYRYGQGESLKSIKEYFLAQDFGATGRAAHGRAMHAYNVMIGFLGIDE